MEVCRALPRSPLLLTLLLGACAVGPDFERPGAVSTGTYVESPLPKKVAAPAAVAGGEEQELRPGNDLIHDWWTLFHSETLNQLVEGALRENPTLAAASAALRQARETLVAGRGNLTVPAVNGQLSAARERASAAELGLPYASTFALYNAQVSVSYTVDLFGSVRRQLEALQAQVDYQENQLRAAQLALTANIVTAVVREAALREQIQALRDVERLQQSGLEIVERRFELGAVTRTDVLTQRTALAQTTASIFPLELQRAQTLHQLAAYTGKAPSELDLAPFEILRMDLPVDLPVSVPSDLVHQRPDILAAESLLHAASAQVGVATANQYPQLTLGGNFGYTALSVRQLFEPDSIVWSMSAALAQPIFHGGALAAQRRAAVAAFDQAAALYRQTVLTAFENVADALRALEFDARTLAAQSEAYTQARAAAELAQTQFDAGAVSYLSLLTAQQQLAQSAVAVVQARANRFADTAALFQALGGGWWNQIQPQLPAKPLAQTE
ncbi:RND efflux system, outer membrane lipoprotein, NodT family [Burkholderiales bacterium]|nr:RND efflux system, outer membrane lipoprotein, NodT family [Burkholderiales bacterium]